MRIYREVTPLVEPLSLDEAYLDVTENAWHEPLAVTVARRLKAAIRDATGLTASAGVAPNKFLAKIASGWKKPDGLTVVAPERVEQFLQGPARRRAVGRRPGHRGQAARRTASRSSPTSATARPTSSAAIVGSLAGWLIELAHGRDDRPVEPNRAAKSSSSECTYATDLTALTEIRREIEEMAREVAGWLARKSVMARTVTIKVRYSDFTTVTRSQSSPAPTQDADQVAARALALLDKTDAGRRPVRLLGVGVHNFGDAAGAASMEEDLRLPFG